jgi:ATP-dependent helicase/nuclease subunit B
MLNIYYGRESIDREAFLFDRIKERLTVLRQKRSGAERLLLVVPAQYTLKAEEAAFAHLGEEGFLDLQILSGNRLRHQIFHETGKPNKVVVNALGRMLLLRSVVRESRSDLEAFQKVADSPEFLSMAGALIAQMKQNDLDPEDLENITQHTEPLSIVRRKLSDMHRIYSAYQSALEGKWIDSEDLLPAVSRKIATSSLIRSSELWFYDFYSFTPRETEFMGELMLHATDLSVVLTGGESADPDGRLFAPTHRAATLLCRRAEELGVHHHVEPVPDRFVRRDRPERLRAIEKQLFAVPAKAAPASATDPSFTMIRAGNPYTESQTIAAEILKLCKEEGYAPEDIAVFTNDIAGRGTILRRMFKLYGIPCFLDEKRAVLHSSLIQTISSLLNLAADDRLVSDVLGFLKTGLVQLAGEADRESFADIEEFENYLLQYHIRGTRFSKPFVYGVSVFGEEGLRKLENTRARLDGLLTPFLVKLDAADTVREKCSLLCRFLSEELHMEEPLRKHALHLDEIGLSDAAQETRQMWNLFVDLLDQIVELMGDQQANTVEFRDILTASFADLKVGLLPQAAHSVLIGTVGRSRLSGVKALFIAGVNDGILPSEGESEGILTDRELQLLEEMGCTLSKNQEIIHQEEELVIYQAFTKPSDRLIVSYSTADIEGGEIRPSPLIAQLREIFPDLSPQPDITHPDRESDLYRAPVPAALHLTSALQRYLSGEDRELSETARQVYDFFLKYVPETARVIRDGLFFSNAADALPASATRELYPYDAKEDLFAFSPTRLEKFAQCPFMHYVTYGLQPRPRESFEITGREIGDVYHECLMRLTRDLLQETEAKGLSVTDAASPWMSITREECDERVLRILDSIRQEIFEGLLKAGKSQEYQTERISLVARTFLWQVICQIRKGHITKIFPEVGFGRHRPIPPLKIPLGDQTVLIEGKIDRIDLLQTGSDYPGVKVIDYKSGQADFDRELILRGLHLQLMVYLESALHIEANAEPAGVFYCYIEDPRVPIPAGDLSNSSLPEDILRALEERYRMEGLFVGESAIVESMDDSLADGEKSTVIPVKRKHSGYDSSRAVSRVEFEDFRKEFRQELQKVCKSLTEGVTDIRPRKLGRERTACTYCDYRSICLFDTDFPQCRYT